MKEIVEEWKDIKGYEGLYKISNLGRVKSFQGVKERILKSNIQNCGYEYVVLAMNGKFKTKNIHRLVAEIFIPNPNNYKEINHIDENKHNNNVNNLEWCTRSYNASYGNTPKSKEKVILQYNKNGDFIKKWKSISEVERQLKISHVSIVNNCKNKRKTAGGYIWKYA